MLLAFALRLPDFSNWKENPVGLALYGLVLVGGALLGGILLGLVGRYTALLFWKELSTRAVLILRLIGGIGGAALTFSLIGSGDGFGPGPGGLPGGGRGSGEDHRPVALRSETDSTPRSDKIEPAPTTSGSLRVLILGPETTPPYEEPDRFFRIEGEEAARAMTVSELVERLRMLSTGGRVQEVELIVTGESTGVARPFIPQLRERVLRDLRLPFSQPDFSANPFKDRSRYEPPKGP
jgi:hypothetical protein